MRKAFTIIALLLYFGLVFHLSSQTTREAGELKKRKERTNSGYAFSKEAGELSKKKTTIVRQVSFSLRLGYFYPLLLGNIE